MKFKNRTTEHLVRSSIAVVLVFLLLIRWDNKLILNYLLGENIMVSIIQIGLLIGAGLLAFGKLRTPAK